MTSKQLLLNLSRIGKNGTGLFIYSKSFLKCLESKFTNITVVASKTLKIKCKSPIIYVPSFISITQSVSKIRPILWLIYSLFFFPDKKSRIISTTHHAVLGAKHQIVTIHDLRPYFYPDSILQKIYFKWILPFSIKKLDGIFTVSEFTRQLIHQYYRVPLEKIFVIPQFINTSHYFAIQKNAEDTKPYLLMVGATWYHKNAHEVIENNSLWSKKYRLKILCGQGSYRKKLQSLVEYYHIGELVDFLDYVTDSELSNLYQNATALIYPSYMEGFGIPPLEAMACGIPVIVSDIPVFREVYGDVPIYVKLGDFDSWAKGFSLLEQNNYISEKIMLGYEKVKEYSEERMLKKIIEGILEIWPEMQEENNEYQS